MEDRAKREEGKVQGTSQDARWLRRGVELFGHDVVMMLNTRGVPLVRVMNAFSTAIGVPCVQRQMQDVAG